jgi:polar amino acid transport system substrate-binding protein
LLEEKYVLQQDVKLPVRGSGGLQSLRLAISETPLPPYCVFDERGGASGFDIELARYICASLGLNLEIIKVSGDRLAETVRFGKADFAMGGIYVTEELRALVIFSDAYTTCVMGVLTRK